MKQCIRHLHFYVCNGITTYIIIGMQSCTQGATMLLVALQQGIHETARCPAPHLCTMRAQMSASHDRESLRSVQHLCHQAHLCHHALALHVETLQLSHVIHHASYTCPRCFPFPCSRGSSRKVSGLTPAAVFALATPKSPIDRGGRKQLQFYLNCIFFTFPSYSLTPTRAEFGIKPHSQSWSPNHGNGRNRTPDHLV
jgi:hypothetical protein